MLGNSILKKARHALAIGLISAPLALAPVLAQAQLAAVVLNKIAAAMSAPAGDFEALAIVISNDPAAAAEIASTAVKLRPDLAGPIATTASDESPEQMLEIASAMAAACPSCSTAIVIALSNSVPTQALAIQIAVAEGAGSSVENPSEGFEETDEENEGTDVASPSAA